MIFFIFLKIILKSPNNLKWHNPEGCDKRVQSVYEDLDKDFAKQRKFQDQKSKIFVIF